MKSTSAIIGSILASVAIAQPHGHHNHAKQHKRGQVTEVAWVTEWDYVTETVDVTTTVWVPEGYVPPTTSSSSTSTSSISSSSSSSTEVPAQFFQPANTPSTTSLTPSTSIYVAPTPTSTYVAPTTTSVAAPVYVTPVESSSSAAPVYVAPVESSSSTTPVYVPETTTVAPVVAAVSTTETTPAVAATTAASSGSSSGTCSSSSPCEGDITYYEAGLGACGWTNDGDVENVVALPHGLMGEQSNGNPYCGKTITIKCTATGKTTTAKVTDKCMGCVDMAIDLSNAAFLDLDDLSVGRTGATWYFN